MRAYEPNEPDEPNEYSTSGSDYEDVWDEYNDDYYYPRESIKYEFLINFWPYVIDEIGKGANLESEIEGVSEKSSPFGLETYEENINEFYKKKQSAIMTQWLKRKLNFEPTISLSFTDEELRSGSIFKKLFDIT
jgi:hypothetical protein